MQLANRNIQLIFVAVSFAVLFLSVVIPNSFRNVATISLLLCAFLSVFFVNLRSITTLFWFHAASSIVTIIYIIVGQQNGAPLTAAIQTAIVYILSPILWLLITNAIVNTVSDEAVMDWLKFCTVASVASAGLFFYLFFTVGPDAVRLFVEDPNITVIDGEAKATMHVYGSLVFLAGGFFASPNAIRSFSLRIFILLSLAIVAFSSGRSALIVAPIFGYAIGFIYRRVQNEPIRVKTLVGGIASNVLVMLTFLLLLPLMDINPFAIMENVTAEFRESGGSERSQQFVELRRGIVASNGLGVGHGIGVDYIRHDDYPWRYELVWVANVLRVGIFGAAIYLLPFLYYVGLTTREFMAGRLSELDLFYFAAFLLAFLASNTNPYLEGFPFQWMYTLPLVRWCHLLHAR